MDPITRRPKPRMTTDKSGPHNVEISGKPVAENEHVDLKWAHPGMTLVTATGIRRAVDVLNSISVQAQEAVRRAAPTQAAADKAARHLEVFMATDDMKAYFLNFVVSSRCFHKNGMAFPREDGTMSFSQSRRMQFGGASSPSWAQRLTNIIVARLSTLMEEEERRFAAAADAGSAPGLLVSPKPLRELLARRRAELGDNSQARASWAAGYIDDLILGGIGVIRTIAMLNNLWTICKRWRIPIAPGKAAFGQRVTVIGYEFRTRSMQFKLTDNKVNLLRAWFRRLRERRGQKVEVKELSSLMGTLVWCRAAIPMSGQFLRRGFGLRALNRHTTHQPKWFRFDLDAIENLIGHTSGTTMRIPCPALPQLSRPDNISWTDACRETKRGSYSGAAGYNLRSRVLWHYKFAQYHVDTLPIHVLEAVAEVLNLSVNGPLLRGEAALAFCDNMSWVTSLQFAKPSDRRLRTLLRMRQELETNFQVKVHSAYVNTKRNIVADEASRGRVDLALAELESAGWDLTTIRVIDLNRNPELGPPDLGALLDHLATETVIARAARDEAERQDA